MSGSAGNASTDAHEQDHAMPKYEITFKDGTRVQVEAANSNDAKQTAKRQAVQHTGATVRSDQRVTVQSIVNLDEQPGQTDPRNAPTYNQARREGGPY
jgi:hypothetical protein